VPGGQPYYAFPFGKGSPDRVEDWPKRAPPFPRPATSRISIRNIDNIHEEILEEVESNTFSPANASLDDSGAEKSTIIRPTPLNYAQEYLYIKMTTTRRDSGAGRHQTMLSPLREAKSARSLLAAVEDEEAVGKIRRPPSPLALPPLEESRKPPEEEKRAKERDRSRERKKGDKSPKLLKAQTVEIKGEQAFFGAEFYCKAPAENLVNFGNFGESNWQQGKNQTLLPSPRCLVLG